MLDYIERYNMSMLNHLVILIECISCNIRVQALAAMLDHPTQESAASVLAVLQDHFQHEEEVMRASGFGGQVSKKERRESLTHATGLYASKKREKPPLAS